MAAGQFSLEKEISGLASFIAIPHIIASPIAVGILHLVAPKNILLETGEVLDFMLISFPLTLSIGMIWILSETNRLYPGYILAVVVGAVLLSNLLHRLIGSIPHVNIEPIFKPNNPGEGPGGIKQVFVWIFQIFQIYWKTFGPILFIQSCCIGLYGGYKYMKMVKDAEKEKKEKEKREKEKREKEAVKP